MCDTLLGIPLAKQARPVEPENTEAKDLAVVGVPAAPAGPESSKEEGAVSVVDIDVALEPLTPQEIEATHQRIIALPQAARQELTKAFREHFQVPRSARSIGDRITQHQHAAFIDHFLEECQEQQLDGAQALAEP